MRTSRAIHPPPGLAWLWLMLMLSCGGGPAPPHHEEVEMITGSYRTVADARAEIVIGEFGDQWDEDLGSMVEAVEVEVVCAEQSEIVWVTEDHLTEAVCRIRLELVEIVTWSPPKARFRVVWEDD